MDVCCRRMFIALLYLFITDGIASPSAAVANGLRIRRSLSENDRQRFRTMSPSDRPSCQPSAPISATQVDTANRLASLRQQMTTNGIQGYYVQSGDAHQSEYTSEYDTRREYISGMSGSAGEAVILGDKAALWTDGRYFLQAEDELDCNWILMKDGEEGVPSVIEWVVANLNEGEKLGASPWLIRSTDWINVEKQLNESSITFEQMMEDLVDEIWTTGRPEKPNSDLFSLPKTFSGLTWQEKIMNMHTAMAEQNSQLMVVTGLDETAWLFNMRGNDIPYNPFFLSFAIVNSKTNETLLYIRNKNVRLTQTPTDSVSENTLTDHLNTGSTGSCAGKTGLCVQVKDYDYSILLSDIKSQISSIDTKSKVIVSFFCNFAIYDAIPLDRIIQTNTPVALQKNTKNPVEVQGMVNAHVRDAVTLIEFLAKLEKGIKDGESWTEVSAANTLKEYRKKQEHNRGLSFPSISGYGGNGAIIHYKPTNETDTKISTDAMYLLDSGGQYLDGTTDVTRTFHFGTPTDFEKECYTRVLMGQIDLADFKFLTGNLGREIDAIARRHLWDVGLNYRHGTGHGIGAFLSVHEGVDRCLRHRMSTPQTCVVVIVAIVMHHAWIATITTAGDIEVQHPHARTHVPLISSPTDLIRVIETYSDFTASMNCEEPARISLYHPRYPYNIPLKEWQFFSDEPGYYEPGKFGVRLENIVYVKKASTKYNFPGATFLEFETITLVPYEPKLIHTHLLSERQRTWIYDYNKKIRQWVMPRLETELARDWLDARTKEEVVSTSGTSALVSCTMHVLSIVFATYTLVF